jgi:hypothetical protein
VDGKFNGAAVIGDLVVFAPYAADVIGIYNADTGNFDASVSTGSLTGVTRKFSGATGVGELVVFAPFDAYVVGIYDTQTGTFDTLVTTGSFTTTTKFIGAATVGDLVVFGPCNTDVVGTYRGMYDLANYTHTHTAMPPYFLLRSLLSVSPSLGSLPRGFPQSASLSTPLLGPPSPPLRTLLLFLPSGLCNAETFTLACAEVLPLPPTPIPSAPAGSTDAIPSGVLSFNIDGS